MGARAGPTGVPSALPGSILSENERRPPGLARVRPGLDLDLDPVCRGGSWIRLRWGRFVAKLLRAHGGCLGSQRR